MSDFGLRIGIEGEKEFKRAIADINSQMRVLGSEMKLVESRFSSQDNSVQALTARNDVLNKNIDAQKSKIESLRSALENAASSFGENDRRTQSWAVQLNNAEAQLNKMERELDSNTKALDGASETMDDTGKSADELGDKISESGKSAEDSERKFGGLSKTLKAVGVAMAAAVAAAAAGAVKLGKEVLAAYADYEQLVGGVDTLFKESSKTVQDYAANAYKTAGLSANEYMETVTGFSASLIQSLGGDTAKAAKYADMAISDMSDNANKMGSDMSSIQNAYQGFAKQNYTMLDNLKLGYGGTKSEMERLLEDARAISGIEYNIESYADVVSAIHVIQESMDITGTTAKEAEKTITGSLGAMKSSFKNFIVGLGRTDSDIEELCENIIEAFKNVLSNVTPIIQNIVGVIPPALDAIIVAVGDLLPLLLETCTSLFASVLSTLLVLLPKLIPVAIDAVLNIVNTIIENLPLLINAAVQIITALIAGLATALPTLIPTAVQAVITIVKSLIDNLPLILNAALKLITGLAEGLLAALPVLIEALPTIINSLIAFLVGAIPQIVETGIALLTSLVAALPTIIEAIVIALPQIIDGIINGVLGAIPQIIEAGIMLLVSLIQALPTIILTIVNALPQIISGIVNALIQNIPQIIQAGITLLTSLIKNLPTIIKEIIKAVPQIIAGLVSSFGSGVTQMADVGKNLVRGLWNGIQSLASWLWDKVSGWAKDLWGGITDFFGIKSPSKKFAELGKYMSQGLGIGFIDEMKSVDRDIVKSIPSDFDITARTHINTVTDDRSLYAAAYSGQNNSRSAGGQIVVQVPLYLDGKQITAATGTIQSLNNNTYKRALGVT
jgi:phage-related protein